jgi:hypothetical protein
MATKKRRSRKDKRRSEKELRSEEKKTREERREKRKLVVWVKMRYQMVSSSRCVESLCGVWCIHRNIVRSCTLCAYRPALKPLASFRPLATP